MTDTQTDSIPLQTAVSVAMQFVKKIYATSQIKDILVEEVEFSEPADQWLITIGFTIKKVKDSLIMPEREANRKGCDLHMIPSQIREILA